MNATFTHQCSQVHMVCETRAQLSFNSGLILRQTLLAEYAYVILVGVGIYNIFKWSILVV